MLGVLRLWLRGDWQEGFQHTVPTDIGVLQRVSQTYRTVLPPDHWTGPVQAPQRALPTLPLAPVMWHSLVTTEVTGGSLPEGHPSPQCRDGSQGLVRRGVHGLPLNSIPNAR